jgi:hypothetical protein
MSDHQAIVNAGTAYVITALGEQPIPPNGFSISGMRAAVEAYQATEGTVTLDVKALAKILRSADGYCTTCAEELAEQMAKLDHAHDWIHLVKDLPDDY